jgi:hypothetical protein
MLLHLLKPYTIPRPWFGSDKLKSATYAAQKNGSRV